MGMILFFFLFSVSLFPFFFFFFFFFFFLFPKFSYYVGAAHYFTLAPVSHVLTVRKGTRR
jgi:hypothetical protein